MAVNISMLKRVFCLLALTRFFVSLLIQQLLKDCCYRWRDSCCIMQPWHCMNYFFHSWFSWTISSACWRYNDKWILIAGNIFIINYDSMCIDFIAPKYFLAVTFALLWSAVVGRCLANSGSCYCSKSICKRVDDHVVLHIHNYHIQF